MMDYTEHRNMMKSTFHIPKEERSDKRNGIKEPELVKRIADVKEKIVLPFDGLKRLSEKNLWEISESRKSRRVYTEENLSLSELSYLLAMTQKIGERGEHFRVVPSGGSRHAYETYLAVQRVDGLKQGIYHYHPKEHALELLEEVGNLQEKLLKVAERQVFLAKGAVVFFWTCIPYRGEWRYMEDSHKSMLLDAGHIGQALYLAVEAIDLGVCTVAGYHQEEADALVGANGTEEYTVYLASVGKCK